MEQKVDFGDEIEGTGYCVAGFLFKNGVAVSLCIEPVDSKFTSWQRPTPQGASPGYYLYPDQPMKIGGRNVTLKYADKDYACVEIIDEKQKLSTRKK